MDGVERAAARDRLADGGVAHVPIAAEGAYEGEDVGRAQIRYDIDVVGGAWLAVQRAGERSRGDIGDAQPLENAGGGEGDAERIGQALRGHPVPATCRRG